jgi:phosphoglycerol transferase MdoB-like AlkP superfamily enzyme
MAYKYLGFDEFIARDDFEYEEKIRKFVSDKSHYKEIISRYEEAKESSDSPWFSFNVTMQNHGGYEKDYSSFPLTLEADLSEEQKGENDSTIRYLQLLRESDEALEYLIEYFKTQDDPTLILFFGDHQAAPSGSLWPKLYPEGKYVGTETAFDIYKVPFMLWANYDIDEEWIDCTSLNYLGVLTARTALGEAGLTGYQRFLQDLQKDYPAIFAYGYIGADGTPGAWDGTYSPELNDYRYLQYNSLKDQKNSDKEFFYDTH